jgi:IS5 family transposase
VHKRSRDIAANLRRRSGDAKDEVAAINADLATIATTKGKPSTTRRAFERRRSFRRLVKWRTGSEGRISCLKRDFGWNRTLMDEIDDARTWCGHGILQPQSRENRRTDGRDLTKKGPSPNSSNRITTAGPPTASFSGATS